MITWYSKYLPINLFILLIYPLYSLNANTGSHAVSIRQQQAYMDQVIHRKKKIIINKCLGNHLLEKAVDVLIELNVSYQGKSKSRVVHSDLKEKNILKCIVSVLNRIQFKPLKRDIQVTRIYHFVVQ